MSAPGKAEDPVVRRALYLMREAMRSVFEARRLLLSAAIELESHPGFIKTELARKRGRPVASALSLAWWVHNCIKSVLEDGTVEEAGDWLLVDSNPKRVAGSMRAFIETDRRDRSCFAARRAA